MLEQQGFLIQARYPYLNTSDLNMTKTVDTYLNVEEQQMVSDDNEIVI